MWLSLSGWFGLWGAAFYFLQTNSRVYDSEYAGMVFLVFISIIVFSISVALRYSVHKFLVARSNAKHT